VPKKNSKTTGGAGIMVDALMLNRRPRAEFLFIGPPRRFRIWPSTRPPA
jgi:phage terminase large subunit-like protein